MPWRATLPLLALLLAGADTAPLDIRAERMELRQKEGVVRFEGQVVATQEDFTLRCAKLTARYEKGAVVRLKASGGVEVHSDKLSAKAERVSWSKAAGTLVFEGAPSVTRGGDRLSGKRIVLHPEEGRVVVEQARGTLVAPKLLGPK